MDISMNEKDGQVTSQPVTVNDFNVVCRVCLQICENMTDIFRSGIENVFMEVTNLKMEMDDKLPRTVCQECYSKMCQYCEFLRLAKSSDTFLRSLLPSVSESKEPDPRIVQKEQKNHTRKLEELPTESQEVENDKMYLIFVPQTGGGENKIDNNVLIKDLNSETEDLELLNYCKNVLRSNVPDHTYHKDENGPNDDDKQNPEISDQENKSYTVNLFIYKCCECDATFEEFNDLTAHLSIHDSKRSFTSSNLICPICDYSEAEKVIFLEHLRKHKEEGFFFVKVNAQGDFMPWKKNEEDLFSTSLPKYKEDCKIFRLSPNLLSCSICFKTIKSVKSIPGHLESCLCGVKKVIRFNIKYTCPICCETFFDEEKKFIKHLSSHKDENCYFLRVSSTGELVQVAEDEKMFVPLEEVTKIFSETSRIFEIVDKPTCDKCDNSSGCNLCDTGSQNISVLFSCPVCASEFKVQDQFFEHLAIHKNEGVSFVLVKKNGMLCEGKQSDIFTQSQFLLSVLRSAGVVFQNISPELVILDLKNCSDKYNCDFCQKKFRSKSKISMHLRYHGVKKRLQDSVNYICEKCGKKFTHKSHYEKHFSKHLNALSSVSKQPVCNICNKKFANRATFDSHMKHHLTETDENEITTAGIICDKCGRSFSNNRSLTRHKKVHLKENDNLFKCDICNRDFCAKITFNRHKAAHVNLKYYECVVCKLPLPTLKSLHKHAQVHKNGSQTFDCKDCHLSFLTKDSLTAHQSHTGHYIDKKPFECNVCQAKFFIGKKFSEHIKTHPKYKVGECTLCGKRLSTSDSLMKHKRRHYESNAVLCPHCGKRFFDDKNYERHLMVHEGTKPFPCDLQGCDKAFYTGFELRRHKRYHTNERDFKCSYCPKSFAESSHLTTHIRTHTGERPYRCPHCNKAFQTRSHCKNHIKLLHRGVGYDLIRSNISKKVAFFEGAETID